MMFEVFMKYITLKYLNNMYCILLMVCNNFFLLIQQLKSTFSNISKTYNYETITKSRF